MSVQFIKVSGDRAGQRIDNFLLSHLKGVPKTRIYRAIRRGEVRVNKGRVKADYRLQAGDEIRVPPIRTAKRQVIHSPNAELSQKLENSVIYEDKHIILLNKTSGIPVHAGSGVSAGLIELFRLLRPGNNLELVHRLDQATSGCLLVAKGRETLLGLQHLITSGQLKKHYLALVKGCWQGGRQRVTAPLRKFIRQSGERMVVVDEQEGKASETIFEPVLITNEATLLHVELITGRTHQIRVHCAHLGHPIVGDRKYGDEATNKLWHGRGVKRMLLHASEITFSLSKPAMSLSVCAIVDEQFLVVKRVLEV